MQQNTKVYLQLDYLAERAMLQHMQNGKEQVTQILFNHIQMILPVIFKISVWVAIQLVMMQMLQMMVLMILILHSQQNYNQAIMTN